MIKAFTQSSAKDVIETAVETSRSLKKRMYELKKNTGIDDVSLIYVLNNIERLLNLSLVWCLCFNGISTFLGYLLAEAAT